MRKTFLSDTEVRLVELAWRVRYFTAKQAADFLSISVAMVRKLTAPLVESGFIRLDVAIRPYAYCLGKRGAYYLAVNELKYWSSASAIHNRLMRNDIEIRLTNLGKKIQPMNRTHLNLKGFNPAIGEHMFESYSQNTGAVTNNLILIDDYCMESRRLAHSLVRIHDINGYYTNSKLDLSWIDYIDSLSVYSTSKSGAESHRRTLEKLKAKDYSLFSKTFRDSLDYDKESYISNKLSLLKVGSFYVKPIWSKL